VTIRTDIAEHKTYTMPPEPSLLVEYIAKTFGKVDFSLAYESGCCGFTAAHYFLMVGWNTTVVNPADIPTMNKNYSSRQIS
jgi:transposase